MKLKEYFKRKRELKKLSKEIDKKIKNEGTNYMFSYKYGWGKENELQKVIKK